MSRLQQKFADLKAAGRKALIPFITAGDPRPEITVPLMHALVAAGADVIELGVPFSDPMADGPVIQRASERALEHHVSLRNVLAMVHTFRQQDAATPVVLMGYLNPVEAMGYAAFAAAAAQAGVDGLLTVDIPPEEAGELLAALRPHGIDPIFLLSPTTADSRIATICRAASGFVYYVSVKGVTGAAHLDVDGVRAQVERIRAHTDLPVGVGFGIRDAGSARAVAQVADAVIVGSALVRRIEELRDDPDTLLAQTAGLIGELRHALDGAH
ncbi:tryptophan synthase subunit alpha [Sulfurivermis fontis]|uniref:tryptophan synthase subunit alpha n=1 Tax=Sulfurivermis fontis TaxID=1972068 RepID=UPI000FDB984C|nr:tryptophan synthase subunit alpha [Sulfurivermis fontis]